MLEKVGLEYLVIIINKIYLLWNRIAWVHIDLYELTRGVPFFRMRKWGRYPFYISLRHNIHKNQIVNSLLVTS